MFLALPLPNSPNSIWLKFTAVVQNAAPGRARRGTARHVTSRHGTVRHGSQRPLPASLPPRWRNMRSLLLWPISFCIFGMCSPWRKSAATVWTVQAPFSCRLEYSQVDKKKGPRRGGFVQLQRKIISPASFLSPHIVFFSFTLILPIFSLLLLFFLCVTLKLHLFSFQFLCSKFYFELTLFPSYSILVFLCFTFNLPIF